MDELTVIPVSTLRRFVLVVAVGLVLTNAVSAGELPNPNFSACEGPPAVPDAATAIRLVGRHHIYATNSNPRLSPAVQAQILQNLGPEEQWQRTWRTRVLSASKAMVPDLAWEDPDVKGGIWFIEMFPEGSAGGLIGRIAACSGKFFSFMIAEPF